MARAGARDVEPAGARAGELSNQDLRDAASRLVEEWRELPPGSVLRCFARSVRAVLRAGCAPPHVPGEAERMTRELLAHRPSGAAVRRRTGPFVAVPRVPQPRRAS